MKKTKQLRRLIAMTLALIMVLALTACGSSEKPAEEPAATGSPAAEPAENEQPREASYTLRVGHSHSESEVPHTEMVAMAAAIEERTNGDVDVEIYASNSLGSNEDTLEQARMGTNIAVYCDPGRLDTYLPGISAISAPYVIEGYEDIAALNDCPTVQAWMDKLENDFGLTVMAWNWCQGFRNVFATRGGTSPDDFRGVQLRCANAPVWNETVKALGATPVALEFGEMYSGIQTKVVDGCEQNYGSIYNNAIYEVISTMTETRHVYLANCVVISSQWLRSLPEEYQSIIIEECQAGGERASASLAELDEGYLEEMVNYGMEVIPYEDLDIAAFKANADKAYETLGIADAVAALKADLGK